MEMSFINIISTSKKITDNEDHLINFINKEPEKFCNNTISNIAKQVNVSVSTITRLVKKLDFDNIKKMQLYVHQKNSQIESNYIISDSKSVDSTLKNVKNYHLYSLNETFNTLNLVKITKLVEDINKRGRLMFYGVGSSYNVVKELAMNLEKIGHNILCNQDFHQQLLNLPNMTKKDQVILFSKNGETKEIQFLIEKANFFCVPVTLITSNKDVKNKNMLSNVITFVTHEQRHRVTAISSKIAQLLVSDFIFMEVLRTSNSQDTVSSIDMGTKLISEWNSKSLNK